MERDGLNIFSQSVNKEQHQCTTGYFIIMVNKSGWKPLVSMNKEIKFFTQEEAENYMYSWQARNNSAPAYIKAIF